MITDKSPTLQRMAKHFIVKYGNLKYGNSCNQNVFDLANFFARLVFSRFFDFCRILGNSPPLNNITTMSDDIVKKS